MIILRKTTRDILRKLIIKLQRDLTSICDKFIFPAFLKLFAIRRILNIVIMFNINYNITEQNFSSPRDFLRLSNIWHYTFLHLIIIIATVFVKSSPLIEYEFTMSFYSKINWLTDLRKYREWLIKLKENWMSSFLLIIQKASSTIFSR